MYIQRDCNCKADSQWPWLVSACTCQCGRTALGDLPHLATLPTLSLTAILPQPEPERGWWWGGAAPSGRHPATPTYRSHTRCSCSTASGQGGESGGDGNGDCRVCNLYPATLASLAREPQKFYSPNRKNILLKKRIFAFKLFKIIKMYFDHSVLL